MLHSYYGKNTPLLEPKTIYSDKNIYVTEFRCFISVLEGIGTVSEWRLKIRGALICGKLVGGAWCCSRPNCWIQGTSENEIVVVLHNISTNGIPDPYIYFSRYNSVI